MVILSLLFLTRCSTLLFQSVVFVECSFVVWAAPIFAMIKINRLEKIEHHVTFFSLPSSEAVKELLKLATFDL